MKIKYLGTAAAEGIPAIFCKCENCTRARALGGKNIRTRSQALVDGKILIDFPADSYMHTLSMGTDFSDIPALLITHVHEDHCYLSEMTNRRAGFAHIDDAPPLNIYGSEDVYKEYAEHAGAFFLKVEKDSCHAANFHFIQPYNPVVIEGYTVTALRAYHGTEHPYIYLVERDGKALLYAHDTDIFPDETWEYLRDSGVKLSFVSLDCTEGTREIRYHGHMYLARDIETRRRLSEIGAADESTLFCLNHFSHNAKNACYDDMKPIADENGFLLSYDGAEFEF